VEDFLMIKKRQSDGEMLKGPLDMMIFRTLVAGDAHGHTIGLVKGEDATAGGGTR
jgi:hypothetical protein